MNHTRGIPKLPISPKGCRKTKGGENNFDEDQLLGMFKRFDKDKNGMLRRQELNEAFSKLGSKFPAWRTWRALCQADANGDGCISEQEINELVKYALKRGYKLN